MASSLFRLALTVQLCGTLINSVPFARAEPTPFAGAIPEDVSGKTFDYIVVGGGLTGLVVANRLSENPHKSVLVIERGYFSNGPRGTVPYWANGLDESVLIRPTSAPNANLNNSTSQVAVAAVVGGGSVVNGMGYIRGSQADYDAWEELGNPGWDWEGLLPYFRKSTTFIPPSPDAAQNWNMTWDPSGYGNGPLHVTIPDFQYPDIATFRHAWRHWPGVSLPIDIGAGLGPGAYWNPSSIDARDMTRSSSRKAYYDPVHLQRPNLHLLIGHVVDEIIFHNRNASGVRISSRDTGHISEVYAKKEVVLAAGAIQTPQLLQVSGVGPRGVLKTAGIAVKRDMPQVGANLHDHPTAVIIHLISQPSFPNPDTINTNTTYNATAWEEYYVNRTGPIAAASASTVALLSVSQISPAGTSSMVDELLAQSPADFLPAVYDHPPLLRGFREQRRILARQLRSTGTAVSSFPMPGNGLAPAAMLKPLSRGTVTLDPANPRGLPVVQYNTFLNPVDADIILAMVKHARSFWGSPRLAILGPVELLPGQQFQTDDEIMAGLIQHGVLWPSLAHPSGTCAMMPEGLGGCVDPTLKVYGFGKLSVVDASILPMIPSAPLQATMYAVAEKAADLIKSR